MHKDRFLIALGDESPVPTHLQHGDTIAYSPTDNTLHIKRGENYVLLPKPYDLGLTVGELHANGVYLIAQFIAAAAGLGIDGGGPDGYSWMCTELRQ